MIAGGRIVAEGTPGTLAGRDTARAVVGYWLPDGVAVPAGFGGTPGPDGLIEFSPDDLTVALHALTGWALDHGVSLDRLRISRPTLEDVYLQLTDDLGGADAVRGANGDGDGSESGSGNGGGGR